MRTAHRWLAQAPIFVMVVVALAIGGAARLLLHVPETWFTTPIIAFVAGYGAWLAMARIRYAYELRKCDEH